MIQGYRKKKNYKSLLIFAIFILTFVLLYFAFKSKIFESDTPQILLDPQDQNRTFWNPNHPITMSFEDSSGIKEYSITATLENGEKVLEIQEVVLDKPKKITLTLPKPKISLKDNTKISYHISVKDWSSANFFDGNTTTKDFHFTIDTTPPKLKVLANSFAITLGGSAAIVFSTQESNLDRLILSNGTNDFLAFPYIKQGYYASIIAWPRQNTTFTPTIIATDKAGNKTTLKIPIVKRTQNYRNSTLKLQDKNFDKFQEMLEIIGFNASAMSPIEKFQYLNANVRQEDESAIFQSASSFATPLLTSTPHFNRFHPLKNGQSVGAFGDFRHYYYKDQNISNAYHMGLDLASVKNAPVFVSNAGKVVFEKRLGLYGNTIVIYHALGVSSSYSHLSKFSIPKNQVVQENQILGYTGMTGLAFGDHLHFGIMVQGHFVSLAEWMDPKWIKNNITSVLQKGEKTILGQTK